MADLSFITATPEWLQPWCVIYTRQSRSRNQEFSSCDAQREMCERFATEQQWPFVDERFDDPHGLHFVIVWPDSPAGRCRPGDRNFSWLDVRAGDQIFVAGKRHTVSAVRVFRADGIDATAPVITCGRDWMLARTA